MPLAVPCPWQDTAYAGTGGPGSAVQQNTFPRLCCTPGIQLVTAVLKVARACACLPPFVPACLPAACEVCSMLVCIDATMHQCIHASPSTNRGALAPAGPDNMRQGTQHTQAAAGAMSDPQKA
jgi:hypothetical protein